MDTVDIDKLLEKVVLESIDSDKQEYLHKVEIAARFHFEAMSDAVIDRNSDMEALQAHKAAINELTSPETLETIRLAKLQVLMLKVAQIKDRAGRDPKTSVCLIDQGGDSDEKGNHH